MGAKAVGQMELNAALVKTLTTKWARIVDCVQLRTARSASRRDSANSVKMASLSFSEVVSKTGFEIRVIHSFKVFENIVIFGEIKSTQI